MTHHVVPANRELWIRLFDQKPCASGAAKVSDLVLAFARVGQPRPQLVFVFEGGRRVGDVAGGVAQSK